MNRNCHSFCFKALLVYKAHTACTLTYDFLYNILSCDIAIETTLELAVIVYDLYPWSTLDMCKKQSTCV